MRHEDIPEINNPKIRFPVLEGDKLMKEVLNGGYNVHPVPPPNSEIKERIRKRYERKRIKIENPKMKSQIIEVLVFWRYNPIS